MLWPKFTEPLSLAYKGTWVEKKLDIISLQRNMLFRSLEIISFERNMLFRSLEVISRERNML